jgi:diguanylate cyclase (GGDEF)-like protein
MSQDFSSPLEQSSFDIPIESMNIESLIESLTQCRAELADTRDQFQAILDAVPGGVSWLDRELRYLGINKHLADTFNIDPQDFIGQRIGFLNASPEFVKFAHGFFDSGLETEMRELLMSVGQEKRYYFMMARKYRGGDSALFVGIDISERKYAELQLHYEAFHDKLTGLPNRAMLLQRLERALARSKQQERYLFAVLFLDFDGFKTINDSLGHSVGDSLLQAVAKRLEGMVRSSDTVARLGGDEYVLLLDDIDDLSRATHIAERIHRAMGVPYILSGQEVFLTVSIGITLNTVYYKDTSEILRDADIAMYRAKRGGRNRYEVFDRSMHDETKRRLEIETDLHRSIENRDFLLHFQPIVDIKTRKIHSFEALIRWNRPLAGFTWPQEFIGIAEETGIIVHIDRWVLRRSCEQMKSWLDAYGEERCPQAINVNLSSRHFSYPDLVEHVAQILSETGLPARFLRLEITESAIMENIDSVAILLRGLDRLGVSVGLDDFGTGYSSLSYLHRLPLEMLKIDRSFAVEISKEAQNSAVVNAIVTLAHGLGMQVVAEGIETAEQMEELRKLNCDYAQGFYFSRGIDVEEATEIIESGQLF